MKRFPAASLAIALIVLTGLTLEILCDREPHYQGRALSQWIEDGHLAYCAASKNPNIRANFYESDHDFQVASHAVKYIGKDAIPFLLKWAQVKDSPLKSRVLPWAKKDPFLWSEMRSSDYYHTKAYFGFMLLGDKGKPARPLLIDWTQSPDPKRRLWALDCLTASQPDKQTIMPVLDSMIHDPDKGIQNFAANRKSILYPQAQEADGFPLELLLKNQPQDRSNADEGSGKK